MNGKGLIVTVIGVGVGLAGLILNGQRATSRDISELRSYVHEEILGLRERMARLEGLFEGHVKGDCSE
jgi:hypothetical protein